MRRLNVLPPELAGGVITWWRGDPLLVGGFWGCGAMAALMLSVVSFQNVQLWAYNRKYDQQKSAEQNVHYQLLEQRERVAMIQTSLESLEEEKTLLDQKLRFLLKRQHGGPFWSKVLTEVSGVLAEKTILRMFEGADGLITFEGEAPDPATINTIIENMNKKDLFRNVRLNFTEAKKEKSEHAFRFEIASELR